MLDRLGEQAAIDWFRAVVDAAANYIGGAFLKHLNEQGMVEPNYYSDMASVLQRIASAEGPERDHGTLEERRVATQYGLDHGLARCSEFFPDAPLVLRI